MRADTWVVVAIVLGAVAFLVRRGVVSARKARAASAAKAGCGDCGCGH